MLPQIFGNAPYTLGCYSPFASRATRIVASGNIRVSWASLSGTAPFRAYHFATVSFFASMSSATPPTSVADGSIGEGSPFQSALALVENANTAGARGWCREAHDLAIAKHVAGREKDLDYTAALARHGMVRKPLLLERLRATAIAPELRDIIRARIERRFVS
jgi:hypothetical protein